MMYERSEKWYATVRVLRIKRGVIRLSSSKQGKGFPYARFEMRVGEHTLSISTDNATGE